MGMTFDTAQFRVKEGRAVDLGQWPTRVDPFYTSKKDYKKQLQSQVAELSDLQQLHYASNRYAMLLIF
ncbi:hypothetical protein [Marinobacter sp. LV10R510-11A]|uniref:hypothetical protein n=1 Tax=Marinobacter sp. LV10R510-11A TaxID=1415568 RepID=UPI001D0D25CB|nr:hypothetical protein [Marinobacter sp. LV10R510-11A]